MKKATKTDNNKRASKSGNRRVLIFRIITFTIPFIFFVALELILWVVDYGHDLPLFIDTPDSNNYILARPDIIKRYFPNSNDIPSVTMEANLFLKEKPKDGIRIFIQGGSTAAGFPYGFGASPAGMLDQRLTRTFPNKTIEVINTAMSAVNSYTLLDFVDEIIEQKPDAILIYAGHNEFLGILGVGSNYTAANSHAANLIFLKLKRFRTFQLIQNMYSSFQSNSNTNANANYTDSSKDSTRLKEKRTMMAKVAKQKEIPIGSDIYQKGLLQFEGNLDLILSKYRSAKIPVLISTLASNIKDHSPFSSTVTKETDKTTLIDIVNKISLGNSILKYNSAITQLEKIAKHDSNAFIYFQLAKIYEKVKQFKKAKKAYLLAKENDLLRFRAPEDINNIIRKSAIKHNAILVDYQYNLSKSSKNGLIGNNFMLEHLHPNLQGYFILADSYYQKLKSNKLLGSWNKSIPTSQAWKERPIIAAEEYAGFAKIVQLKSDYPYTDKPIKVVLPKPSDWQQEIGLKYYSKSISWLEMLNLSYKGYLDERNIPMILKTSEMIADAMPQNSEANFRVGKQQLLQGNKMVAKRFFSRALLENPDNKQYQEYLARATKKVTIH